MEQVIVCVGGRCRRSKGHAEALELARATGVAFRIPCQDICKGPVVGIRDHGKTRWYRKVRGSTKRALEQFLRTGSRPRALGSAEVRKRRDKVRNVRRMRAITGGTQAR